MTEPLEVADLQYQPAPEVPLQLVPYNYVLDVLPPEDKLKEQHQLIRQKMLTIRNNHQEMRDAELPVLFAEKMNTSSQYPTDDTRQMQPVYEIGPKQQLDGHSSAVYTCAWSPNSRFIASGGMDQNLIIWSVQTNWKTDYKAYCTVKASKYHDVQAATFNTALGWSPNNQSIVFGGLDCQVYLSSIATKDRVELHKMGAYISCACFLDDAHTVCTSGDGTAMVADVVTGEILHQFNHLLDALSVDVNGEVIATGSADGYTRVWDWRAPSNAAPVGVFQHKAEAHCVKFHPGGYYVGVVTSNNRFLLFDRRTEHLLLELGPESQRSQLSQQNYLRSLAFSKSGRLAFAAGENKIFAFDVMQGAFLGVVGGHESYCSCVCTNGEGLLASSGWDMAVKIWG